MPLQRESWHWNSTLLSATVHVVRWGHFGTPVLLFPTAGGSCDEVERFHLIDALRGLIDRGRIKVFSVDGVAARTWLRGTYPPEHCARMQTAYDTHIRDEVVPLIRRDCHSDSIEVIAAGAGFGASSALTSLCTHPDVFRMAIAVSGVFDLSRYVTCGHTPAVRAVLPLHYLPDLEEGLRLTELRRRLVLLATGEGDFELPEESERLASVLLSRGIPCHLELLGPERSHSWQTWREVFPRYLAAHA
jgi:esterase/lipase superfamily enzyme